MVFPFQDELLKEATVNERKASCFKFCKFLFSFFNIYARHWFCLLEFDVDDCGSKVLLFGSYLRSEPKKLS